ncbi:hypothetical protein [Methylocystis heyeri]|uniref:Uncharacterized protein n=1 Tax=Methylocystis heyeri TaxID=391905 RepID=A0A6B8KGN2_9HYPH|nr:hypothetical protein [Methylocystis heyeri]QGM46151.1 hypothetical protein H2LOC_010835 [Methylocystis heyeri]
MRFEYQISLKVDMNELDDATKSLMNDAIKQAAQLIFAQASMIMQGDKRAPQMAVTCDDGYTDTVTLNPFD